MIPLPKLFKIIERSTIDNSPMVLTAVGIVGVISTAVLAHKAANRVRNLEDESGTIMHGKEQVKRVWICYVPAVTSGTITIGAIVMANRVGTKRAAAVAAAYTISEKAFSEYRDKVSEKFGETKAQGVRDEIAADYVRENPPRENNVIMIGGGDVLCCELYTGRYFNSSMEELKKAQNDTNYEIINNGCASLTDFYNRVGLPSTSVSDEVGWNTDKLLELDFTTILAEDGRPCIACSFQVEPIRRYHHLH